MTERLVAAIASRIVAAIAPVIDERTRDVLGRIRIRVDIRLTLED